jgi:hypothetical protein
MYIKIIINFISLEDVIFELSLFLKKYLSNTNFLTKQSPDANALGTENPCVPAA